MKKPAFHNIRTHITTSECSSKGNLQDAPHMQVDNYQAHTRQTDRHTHTASLSWESDDLKITSPDPVRYLQIRNEGRVVCTLTHAGDLICILSSCLTDASTPHHCLPTIPNPVWSTGIVYTVSGNIPYSPSITCQAYMQVCMRGHWIPQVFPTFDAVLLLREVNRRGKKASPSTSVLLGCALQRCPSLSAQPNSVRGPHRGQNVMLFSDCLCDAVKAWEASALREVFVSFYVNRSDV